MSTDYFFRHNYCNSIIYSKSQRICDVFNMRGGVQEAQLIFDEDFRYYETKNASIMLCWQGLNYFFSKHLFSQYILKICFFFRKHS